MTKTAKRYFTQKELEKHISARLLRERKKHADLELVREMIRELAEKGIIDTESPEQAAERLSEILESIAAEKGSDTAENAAKHTGDAIVGGNGTSSSMDADSSADTAWHTEISESDAAGNGEDAAEKAAGSTKVDIAPGKKDIRGEAEKLNADFSAEAAELSERYGNTADGNEEDVAAKDRLQDIIAAKQKSASTENIPSYSAAEKFMAVLKAVADENAAATHDGDLGKIIAEDDVFTDDSGIGEHDGYDKKGTFDKYRDLPFNSTETNEDNVSEEADHVGNGMLSKGTAAELERICCSLLELVNAEKQRREREELKNARRSICSTGFSVESAVSADGHSDELTPRQREIARRSGLTYREYARLLSEIPENIKKRRQNR